MHYSDMDNLYKKPMIQIIATLQQKVATMQAKERVAFRVPNPDIATSTYSGSRLKIGGEEVIYRSYKNWLDLSQLLYCKMLTPKIIDENFILMRYEKLDTKSSFHQFTTDKEQKYGAESLFSNIHKNEEAGFIYYYLQALNNVNLKARARILNLGINSGDEFDAIFEQLGFAKNSELIGIDYCQSAINIAKEKFKNMPNVRFYQHDINDLATLNLGEFDLIITIGTLQSSNLNFNTLLMSIVQNQLKKDGAMILGFPNCRWIDGEMVYGARAKNYPFPEMGLLYKDVFFSKKYLQQKKFRVTITGKDYIFLTATSIRKERN